MKMSADLFLELNWCFCEEKGNKSDILIYLFKE